jgi:hypothetical protein
MRRACPAWPGSEPERRSETGCFCRAGKEHRQDAAPIGVGDLDQPLAAVSLAPDKPHGLFRELDRVPVGSSDVRQLEALTIEDDLSLSNEMKKETGHAS